MSATKKPETSKIVSDILSEPDDILKHYGIKGMRWGRRRSREELNSGEDSSKNDNPSRADKGRGIKSGGNRTRYEGSPKRLTDTELRARISRLEAEKQYKKLNARTVSAGEKFATELLATASKKAGSKLLAKVLEDAGAIAVKNALNSTLSPAAAEQILKSVPGTKAPRNQPPPPKAKKKKKK